MPFLYGNHVLKGGLGRITENINHGDGVVVFSMSDVPLGFGIAVKSMQECRKMDPNGIVVLHQSDVGEFFRMEDELCFAIGTLYSVTIARQMKWSLRETVVEWENEAFEGTRKFEKLLMERFVVVVVGLEYKDLVLFKTLDEAPTSMKARV